jgi:hypothetical protein
MSNTHSVNSLVDLNDHIPLFSIEQLGKATTHVCLDFGKMLEMKPCKMSSTLVVLSRIR